MNAGNVITWDAARVRPASLSRASILAVKRTFDIIASASTIVLLLPLLAVVAVAIKLDSPGPIFFSQLRYGLNNKPFRIWKFRTMWVHLSDPSGVNQTRTGDDRITRVGLLLRRTNIDELPQLWNILRGEMSVVGPRPHAIGMLAAGRRYEHLCQSYFDRHAVRPGLTGLAQAQGYRGPTFEESKARMRVKLDLAYCRHMCLGLDLQIIWKTARHELFGGTGL